MRKGRPASHKPFHRTRPLMDPEILGRAMFQAFAKLNPVVLARNPVIFVVEVGAAVTTFLLARDVAKGEPGVHFGVQIAVWLWFTVLFANFAEALAEARGKAQADTLRKARTEIRAKRIVNGDQTQLAPGSSLRAGDLVLVAAGDLIPADGEVVEGIATVDESVITGESAPVIRESGGDRSAVVGGTRVLSDQIRVRITSHPGQTFLDRMIALVEGAQRQKTPNEIALNILIAGMTLIFLIAVVTLEPLARYSADVARVGATPPITILIALLVCLIPTTIGGLLSAIGIAGMDRVMQHNILAMSGRAVEAAGDVNTVILDKTGTITVGDRQAVQFMPANGVTEAELVDAAQLASLADETPEGRSIVVLAKRNYGLRGRDISSGKFKFIPFSAYTRMSGVDCDGQQLRKGAVKAIAQFVSRQGGTVPQDVVETATRISQEGGTPLAVAEGSRTLGVVYLKDVVKGGIKERLAQLRKMGIRSVMITGDNPLTAAAIAEEAGTDDFLAQASPADKMNYIRKEQAEGRLVAMTGDGTNDAPALAQADVGLAMNSGTVAAKEAGNMVDLDSNPTKLLEVVSVGKQLLITRGALTTFSIANDLAKYFAILPALFMTTYPSLAALNIMALHTPQSAVLSAVIFNALIIVALVPLALRGVKYRPGTAASLLRRNLFIYGLGGVIVPFPGIWLIDRMVCLLGLA